MEIKKAGIILKKEFEMKNAKLVYTKDELGYQEVLDQMPGATKIVILTYNISEKQHSLLNVLKNVGNTAEISIITNIPNRWERYYKDNYRELAQKKIGIYMTKLRPEAIGEKANVYFQFNNHGKIIMTNKVVYIGSANYSEESAANIEFGIISYDPDTINFLFEELIPDIINQSKSYYLFNYHPLLLEAELILSALHKQIIDLHDQLYRLHDDIDGEWWFFNDFEDSLSWVTCTGVCDLMNDLFTISGEIYDAVQTVSEDSEECLDKVEDIRDQLHLLKSQAEDIIHLDSMFDLAHFSLQDRTNTMIESDYGMVAYDENLDYYVEKASDRAYDELERLASEVEDDAERLFELLKEFYAKYRDLLDYFITFELKKENPDINNT